MCLHCQQPLPQAATEAYCCHGCETAHRWISQLGLDGFYRLLTEQKQSLQRAEDASQDYDLYDDPVFQQEFVATSDRDAGVRVAHGIVDGLTCYACVWLIEKAVQVVDSQAVVKINLTSGATELTFSSQGSTGLGHLIRTIDRLGYRFIPNRDRRDGERYETTALIRMGVALFCFANIMLLATADYLDPSGELTGNMAQMFRWIAAGFATVSLTFGGQPFFVSSLRALKLKKLSIDLSIVAALVAAYSYSLLSTVRGSGLIYFDSIAAVISLLLVGRFFQQRMLNATQRKIMGYHAINVDLIRVHEGERKIIKKIVDLSSGEEFSLRPGESVPVNAILISSQGTINYGDLTGEADTQELCKGQSVRAGAVVMVQPTRWRADQDGRDSYILRAREAAEKMTYDKGRYTAFSEKVSSIFTGAVLILALAVFVYFYPQSFDEAFRRSMATLLISCSCVFGFGTPLVFARSAWLGLKNGVAFRSQRSIEGLARIRDIYWDKTGTLTKGQTTVQKWQFASEVESLASADLAALIAAESGSSHHALRAIGQWVREHFAEQMPVLLQMAANDPLDLREYVGQGVIVRINGDQYRIGNNLFVGEATCQGQVYLARNDRVLAAFTLEDVVHSEAPILVKALQNRGLKQTILSGDDDRKTEAVARTLGINNLNAEGRVSPTGKAGKIWQIERQRPVAMIGNGVNDALALAKSSVGVAVKGSSDTALRSADVCLLNDGIKPVWAAFQLAWQTRAALQRSLGFAILYNVVGLTLAINGAITPVVAALLMPVSSITVLLLATTWNEGKDLPWKSSIS